MLENNIPNHVAIIPDGNRRWAKERGLPTFAGHKAGADRIREISKHAKGIGISTLTFWALSTENWVKRPGDEVKYLIALISDLVRELNKDAEKNETRFIHLGRKDRLPKSLINLVRETEEKTQNYSKHHLNIGLDYGGRDEILRAVGKARKIDEEITEELFSSLLDTAGQPHPNPDLIIRTSGEQRLSGLMPWQSDYAELYFEKAYLPDFTTEKFDEALADYASRKRRFGA